MSFYSEEILSGMSDVPIVPYLSKVLVYGENSQVLFSGSVPGSGRDEVIFAASQYGFGRVFAVGHDNILEWWRVKAAGLEGEFITRIIKWLTRGSIVDDSNTVEGSKLDDNSDLSRYKIIMLSNETLSDRLNDKIRAFVDDGGALFCSITAWSAEVSDLLSFTAIKFLKKFCGILITNDVNDFDAPQLPLSKNQAKILHLKDAINKVCKNYKELSNPIIYSMIDYMLDKALEHDIIQYIEYDTSKLMRLMLKQSTENSLQVVPTEKTPVTNSELKCITKLLSRCFSLLGATGYSELQKAKKIDEFPYDFARLPSLKTNISLKLTSKYDTERLSTGYYLPAGVQMSVTIVKGDPKGWYCRIGSIDCVLADEVEFPRWPVCDLLKKLDQNLNFKIISALGGLVYFDCPNKGGNLDIKISNVVEAPFFDVTNKEYSNNWLNIRNKPGLWAELAGKYVMFTVPSSDINQLNDPKPVLDYWDQVILQHHIVRGTDPNLIKRERICACFKLCAGSAHAGYPIMTGLEYFKADNNLLDTIKIKKDFNDLRWGLFHEIGHNMQRHETWNFDGATEITVNIFSMHAEEKIQGVPILKQFWILENCYPRFADYFSKTPNYDDWQNDPYMALMMFAQLIVYFGWEAMYSFMKDYENDMINNKAALPTTNQDKIDQWVIRYSKIIKRNIKPQFKMFGLPVSDAVDAEVNKFDVFNPLEEKNADLFFRIKNSILNGLSEIPVALNIAMGIMRIKGKKAKALFSMKKSEDVVLAISEYGKGRVFASGHDIYLQWWRNKATGVEGDFIKRIISWLTKGSDANDTNTIEVSKLSENYDLSRYKMLILSNENYSVKLNEDLRAYVENGGSIFISLTYWAIDNSKTVLAQSILDLYCDIGLTKDFVGTEGTRLSISQNKA